MEILRIENLSFQYPGASKAALKEINLSISEGDFVLLCGTSGCGKTTLLRLIKNELAPAGQKSGRILYAGKPTEEADEKTSAAAIGYVMQNPDSQIVTDRVYSELAFGLENLGVPSDAIRRRVGEMANYFGIADWFRKKTNELSGGQKQLLSLACVMVMQPRLLILDEPTGQLDPIAAADFIATLQKINRELGLTVLLAEHRLEEIFPVADRVLCMENGSIRLFDTPRAIGAQLGGADIPPALRQALPSAMRIYRALGTGGECPLSVREGREYLAGRFAPLPCPAQPQNAPKKAPDGADEKKPPAIALKNVWFRYEKDLPDVLRGVTEQIETGELYCLLGGNGSGKTTVLRVLAALQKPYRGKVRINGKTQKDYRGNTLYRHLLSMLPQNPSTVFLKDTVRADLDDVLENDGVPRAERAQKIDAIANKLGIAHLLQRHPFDLSGGEQQKCALAKLLLTAPKILLLDEPTKGIDAAAKQTLRDILRGLCADGITILMVSHDIEFAAETADRCALFFDGEILGAADPRTFFRQNNFYTTAASRIARGLYPDAVSCADVMRCCRESEAL